jgi:hypothetical protein
MTSVRKKSYTRKIHTINRVNKNVKQNQKTVILTFLTFLNTVKLFHWKTFQYSIHKATDDLYSKIGENIDRFVEVMLGKKNNGSDGSNPNLRIDLLGVRSIPLKDFKHVNHFLDEVQKFKQFLLSFERMGFMKEMSNQDLFTIRDEMLADINQFLYLSTLS